MNDAEPRLSECGCCEGVKAQTPVRIENPPGLTALAYRVGTHSRFKQSMQTGLTGPEALRALKTRRGDDPTIGLLDAWAAVLDVLTFYQERIANEGFLRTATERRSLLELARSIGYELRPGVAAGTWLAFTMETTPGAPRQATLAAGVKAQSVPDQGEQAQTFETIEEIVVRPVWNQMPPQPTQFQELEIDAANVLRRKNGREARLLHFQGANTGVAAGDLLLLTTGTKALVKRVLKVTIREPSPEEVNRAKVGEELRRTTIELEASHDAPVDWPEAVVPVQFDAAEFPPGTPAWPFGRNNVVEKVFNRRWRESDLQTFLRVNHWNADDLTQFAAEWRAANRAPGDMKAFVFREHAGFFGNNAPPHESLRDSEGNYLFPDDWDATGWKIWDSYPGPIGSSSNSRAETSGQPQKVVLSLRREGYVQESAATRGAAPSTLWSNQPNGPCVDVFLDRPIPGLGKDSWTVFSAQGLHRVYQLAAVLEASPVGFGMSSKSTGLMLRGLGGNPPDKEVQFLVRSTTACLKSEELKLAALPIPDLIEVGATELALDRMILGLQPSQLVVLSGEQQDAPGVRRQELLELQEIIHHQGLTTLLFREQSSRQGLQYAYLRHTVTLNANVARATHGETKREVLGSGAAAQAFQKFLLKQAPLTYVSAPTPSGSASTLELRVNDVRWDESPGFYRVSPRQRTFVTRRDDDGKTTVKMGNGVTGARLPSGVENITAKYRVGLGLGGMVKAGQISLLLTRPPGLKEVVNPLPATGGADPENRDQARENAPLTVLTLDRIVSLQDFEDYTRAYPGIGKAQAVWLWDGEGKVIHLTIAGADGGPVPPGSTLYDNLRDSIKTARDPGPHVRISSYEPLTFDLKARLLINRAYFADKVKAEVTAKVNAAFSFGCRAFGRAVTKSEVFAVMQGVEGVEAVDLDKFHLSSKEATLEDRLPARTAEWNDTHSEIRAGELLLVNPRKIQLTEIAP